MKLMLFAVICGLCLNLALAMNNDFTMHLWNKFKKTHGMKDKEIIAKIIK